MVVYGYLKNISLKDKSRVEINDTIYCLLTEKKTSQQIRFIQGDMPIHIFFKFPSQLHIPLIKGEYCAGNFFSVHKYKKM